MNFLYIILGFYAIVMLLILAWLIKRLDERGREMERKILTDMMKKQNLSDKQIKETLDRYLE